MTMEDKTFITRLLALVIAVVYGSAAADEFRRAAIREFGAHLYKDDVES